MFAFEPLPLLICPAQSLCLPHRHSPKLAAFLASSSIAGNPPHTIKAAFRVDGSLGGLDRRGSPLLLPPAASPVGSPVNKE